MLGVLVVSYKPISVNVRIISATNKNLNELVNAGAFREDLYFRINVIPLHIPPLRERTGDISLLAEAFFQRKLLLIRILKLRQLEDLKSRIFLRLSPLISTAVIFMKPGKASIADKILVRKKYL